MFAAIDLIQGFCVLHATATTSRGRPGRAEWTKPPWRLRTTILSNVVWLKG
jgi:hypothetical protein